MIMMTKTTTDDYNFEEQMIDEDHKYNDEEDDN